MALIKIPTLNTSLTIDATRTFLTADTASGVSSLTVKNITGFAINQILVIGELGNEGSEIIKTHTVTAPTGSTITLAASTIFPHSSSTPVIVIPFDQVEFSTAATTTGAKTVLTTSSLVADAVFTAYNDTTVTSGYYFARFKNSITSTFSAYSDPIPVTGYTILTARSIIDNALDMINKKRSDVLSDEFSFRQIDNCQIEVLRELKRWSFMQSFDTAIGESSTGTWRVAVPTDLDDQNTNKSIYNFKLGTDTDLIWIDKEKWNQITEGIAHTTLGAAIILGATTITLTDSSDFTNGGAIYVGANTYSYSANNRTTGVLTLDTTVHPAGSTTTNSNGADTFQGAALGRPTYWTTFGGYLYHYPVTSSSFTQRNYYLDYYKSLTTITTDSQTTVIPDPTVAQYYLAWKMLLKVGNGENTPGSDSLYSQYITRREKLKQKETMNRTFRLKPLKNSLDYHIGDDRRTRLGNFENI